MQRLLEQLGIALIQAGGKLLAQLALSRWRNGCDDMAPPDRWAIFGLHACIVPSTLRPQPQRQGGDLCGARVDVHAVDVVFDDLSRYVAQKCRFVLICLA
ncbi:hypothetical protein D3C85_1619290 [compost metagenome]